MNIKGGGQKKRGSKGGKGRQKRREGRRERLRSLLL